MVEVPIIKSNCQGKRNSREMVTNYCRENKTLTVPLKPSQGFLPVSKEYLLDKMRPESD